MQNTQNLLLTNTAKLTNKNLTLIKKPEKKTSRNHPNTHLRFQTPIRIGKRSRSNFYRNPRPNIYLHQSKHFRRVRHTPFEYDKIPVILEFTHHPNPNCAPHIINRI